MNSQFTSQDGYPYFLSDVSYDMFANQYGSPILTPDMHSASSPWSAAAFADSTRAGDDYDHDDDDHHDDTASSHASSPKHSGHERHSSTGSAKKSSSSSSSSRANRYKNCSEAALSRRRAQNRENQRAYRKRKEERIVELQQQLDEMSRKNEVLSEAYNVLSDEYGRLKAHQQQQQQQQPTIKTEHATAGSGAADWQPSSLMLDPKMLGSAAGTGASYREQWWGLDM